MKTILELKKKKDMIFPWEIKYSFMQIFVIILYLQQGRRKNRLLSLYIFHSFLNMMIYYLCQR